MITITSRRRAGEPIDVCLIRFSKERLHERGRLSLELSLRPPPSKERHEGSGLKNGERAAVGVLHRTVAQSNANADLTLLR